MDPVLIIFGIIGMVMLASVVYVIARIVKGNNNSSYTGYTGGATRSEYDERDHEIRELCKTLTAEELYNKACEYVDKEGYKTDHTRWKAYMSASASKDYIPAVREWGLYNKYEKNNLALELLTRAAEAGDSKAVEKLYDFYYFGVERGTPKIHKSKEKAVEVITPYAEKGNAVALRLLGEHYQYRMKDEDKARELYLKAAEGGDAEAMCKLADIHFFNEEYEEQKKWLLKAAELNYADAECSLAIFYRNLDEYDMGEPDYPQALQWYKRASEHGDSTATCHVGEMILNGEGTIKDEYEAFSWFKKAVDEGSVYGTYLYGKCYLDGTGVAQDKKKGIELITEAAEYDEDAQCALGICYLEGNGVEKDLKKAVFYLEKAVSDEYVKNEEAEAKLEELRASGLIK